MGGRIGCRREGLLRHPERRRVHEFLRQVPLLHPDDAQARGLKDGDAVELHNERGAVTFVLRVGDETSPGVVFVPVRPGTL